MGRHYKRALPVGKIVFRGNPPRVDGFVSDSAVLAQTGREVSPGSSFLTKIIAIIVRMC
jgi:hypothetical protein